METWNLGKFFKFSKDFDLYTGKPTRGSKVIRREEAMKVFLTNANVAKLLDEEVFLLSLDDLS
jgi:hypothetical protein